MLLHQAPKGKQAKLAEATIAYTTHSGAPVILEQGTGIKPQTDSPRGIKIEVLDGAYANNVLIIERTTLLA